MGQKKFDIYNFIFKYIMANLNKINIYTNDKSTEVHPEF